MKKKNTFFKAVAFFLLAGFLIPSCTDFFEDGNNGGTKTETQSETKITRFEISESSLSLKVGEMASLSIKYSPERVKISDYLEYDYDSSIVALKTVTSTSIIVEAVKEGTCYFKVSAGDYSDTVILKVEGYSDNYIQNQDPYIYSATSIVDMKEGENQKIYVSLYNGTVSDNNNYTWTIDNKEIASISPTGQYCIIKGLAQGYAQITVRNTAATYPYYIGVYVSKDGETSTYITTNDNIVTLYKGNGDKTITATLVNPKDSSLASKFEWNTFSGPNGEYDSSAVSITSNGDKCVLTPVHSGTACIRVRHPDATGGYPLDIIVRVITIVDNVYVVPEATLIEVSDRNEHSLKSTLTGTDSYDVDDFWYEVSDERMIETYEVGDTIYFKGKYNGAVSIYIHHEKAEKARQVLVLLSNQEGSSIDSSCYITTTQNYVKTKVGAEETHISISLKGGSEGDEKDFTWAVKQNPSSGTGDVIKLETTNGSVMNAVSRVVQSIYANGSAVLTPLNEGTATIILTHPKVYYPTEILVKVLSKDALLEDPLYFKGDSIVRFLNSDTYEYTVTLSGENKSASDDSEIVFESENATLKILSSSNTANLSSSATGQNVAQFNITHPKAENPKNVLVLTADTEEELANMKAFYTDKKYYSMNVGTEIDLYANTVGFEVETDDEGNKISDFDWKAVSGQVYWTTSNSSIATVEKMSGDMPLFATVKGKASGKATIKVEYENCSCEWEVTVYPKDVEIGKIETSVYLTTTQNVINLASEGRTKNISVSAVGLAENEYSGITWTSSDSEIISAIGNGTSATITSLKEGEAVITVDHEKSENSLKIYVRVGNEYVSATEPVVVISANQDVFTILKDAGMQKIEARLLNYSGEETDTWNFSFECDDKGIASIQNQFKDGKCYFVPKEAGQAVIKIKNPLCSYEKEILVVVANTEEELKGFKYLTTKKNVVTVGEGSSTTLDVSIENADDVYLSGFAWNSSDAKIAGISSTTASTALITGNKIGTTEITVRHSECSYPLKIIIQVVDPLSVVATPYIQVSSAVQTLTVSSNWTEISAELVGGSAESAYNFTWTSKDPSILEVVGNHDIGKIRAKSEGKTYVICSNSEAPYPVQILCICSSAASDSYSISLSSTNRITLEPDDGTTTITATLNSTSGSTDLSDVSLFMGSLDVYGIVDLQFNDNSFYITPVSQGQTTLTITHPKALYPKSVIIKVSKYSDFAIGSKNYYSIPSGETTYIDMEVPSSNVDSKIIYTVQNEKIATATGTKAVCSLTGLQEGSTLLNAKVVALNNPDNVLYEAEVYVTVTPADTSATYITTGASIYTITKDTTKTLSADIVGKDVSATDSRSLKWKSSDPSVISITGADSTGTAVGENVYVKAVGSGETTITISHEKSSSDRIIYVIVPGQEKAVISLNKTYMEIEKGTKTSTITATVDGDDCTEKDILWSVEKVNGSEIARILGSGKTVSLYGIRSGTTNIVAALPNGSTATCQLEIAEPKSLKLQKTIVRVQPNHTVELPYTISPDSDSITVNYYADDSSGKEYVSVEDMGHSGGEGKLLITGISTGTGESATTTCMIQSSSGSIAQVKIICAWDYYFRISKASLSTSPKQPASFTFKSSPQANVSVECKNDLIGYSDKIVEVAYDLEPDTDGYYTGTIKVSPVAEGSVDMIVTAKNPYISDETKSIIGTQQILVNSYYSNLTPLIEVSTSTGNFSYYDKDSQILHIGDGEGVNLKFGFEEEGATYSDLRIEGAAVYNDGKVSFDVNTKRFVSSTDTFAYEYKVIEGYAPNVEGNFDGVTNQEYLDTWHSGPAFNRDSHARCDYIVRNKGSELFKLSTTGHCNDRTVNLKNGETQIVTSPSPIRVKSLDGKVFSEKQFQENYCFYLPSFNFGNGDSRFNHENGEIFYPYVSAIKRITANTAVTSSQLVYKITLKWKNANGKTQETEIPVYLDERNCHQKQRSGYEWVKERAIKGVSYSVYDSPTEEKMTVTDK